MATRIYGRDSWQIGDIREPWFNVRREKQENPIIAKGNRFGNIVAKW